MIDIIDAEQISVFGTSAKYIDGLQKSGATPRKSHKLDHLRLILSTGSPLSHESRYVYRTRQMSVFPRFLGGHTPCFVLGNPAMPVWKSQIQCRGLGMVVEIWNANGQSVLRKKES